jgi:hypothetical protein
MYLTLAYPLSHAISTPISGCLLMGMCGWRCEVCEENVHANGQQPFHTCDVRFFAVRPLVGRELVEQDTECIVQSDPAIAQVTIGSEKTFAFDHVFDIKSQQVHVFDDCVQPLLHSFIGGFNSTILAYGQTGSGKTWTIGTANQSSMGVEDQGIIPRTARALFDELSKRKKEIPACVFDVRVCFLEIYGEDIRDLLNIGSTKVLAIREADSGISVSGALERTCETMADMLGALEEGSMCRTTASTMMNTHSSRSHAIFTVILDQRIPYSMDDRSTDSAAGEGAAASGLLNAPPPDAMEHRISKFHILDLAGSERAKRTQATGKRLQEGININLGLLALGNVISALGDEEKRRKGAHVPYRDSKLTRILQDSLGGNSKTLMVACVSPAEANFEESLNTLRYAARARNIKNKPVINRDPNASQIAQLKSEIEALRAQLHASAGSWPDALVSGSPSLRGAGVSLQALLDATNASNLSEVVDKLSAMRLASEEVEMLRLRAISSDEELLRLTAEVKRLRFSIDHEVDSRISAEAKATSMEDRIVSMGLDPAEVFGKTREDTSGTAALLRKLHAVEEEVHQLKEAARAAPSLAPPYMGSYFGHSPMGSVAADIEFQNLLADVDHNLLVGLDEGESNGAEVVAVQKRLSFDVATSGAPSPPPTPDGDDNDEVQFSRRQTRMGNHVDALDNNIGAKEKLMHVLLEKNRELEKVKSIYDTRLREMHAQILLAAKERDRLQQELMKVEHVAEEERERVTIELTSKLQATTDRLRELQAKAKDAEALSKIKARTDSEIRKLHADILVLKKARFAQLGVMKLEKQRFHDQLALRQRDVQRLQKEGDDLKGQLAKARMEGAKKDLMLKRKAEEAANAQKRLRRLEDPTSTGISDESPGKPASREQLRTAALAAVAKSVKAARRKTQLAADYERSDTRSPTSKVASAATVGLRRQLENAVARIAEKDRRVDELEKRLKSREQDLRMCEKSCLNVLLQMHVYSILCALCCRLESLIEQRDAIKSSLLNASMVQQAVADPANIDKLYSVQTDKAVGFDPTLIEDINAFFADQPGTVAIEQQAVSNSVTRRGSLRDMSEE